MNAELFNATLEKIFMKSSDQVLKERFSAKSEHGVCNGCNGNCSGRHIEIELNTQHEQHSN